MGVPGTDSVQGTGPGRADGGAPGLVRALVSHPAARIFVAMAFIQGSLFVSGMLVVRAIGIESRGELALLSAVVGIACQVGLQGLPSSVLYFVASRHLRAITLLRSIRGHLAWRVGFIGALGALAVLALGRWSQPLQAPVAEAVMVFVGISVLMVGYTLLAGAQGEQRYTLFTALEVLPPLVYAVSVIALFVTHTAGLIPLLVTNALGWVLLALIAVIRLRRPSVRVHEGEPPGIREVRSFGIRSWVAAAAPTDLLGVQQILIGTILGHSPLGLFVIGWAFETGTLLPGSALASFVGPKIAAAPVRDQLHTAWTWLFRALLAGVLVCAPLELVLEPVLKFAFGAAALGALEPARILVIAGVFLGLRRTLAVTLQALDRPHWSTVAELASFVVMVVGVTASAEVSGLVGCCWAMALAGLVGCVVQVAMLGRLTGRRH